MSKPTQPPVALEVDELVVRRFETADAPRLSLAIERSLPHLEPWMPWARDEPMSPPQRIELIEEFRARWERASDFSYGLFVDDAVAAPGEIGVSCVWRLEPDDRAGTGSGG